MCYVCSCLLCVSHFGLLKTYVFMSFMFHPCLVPRSFTVAKVWPLYRKYWELFTNKTKRHSQVYIHSPATLFGKPCYDPGWTPLCLQNCLNSSWHRFNKLLENSSEILVHIYMIASRSCCRFVGCTSMMRISRSTTSQRCSIGLRSGDCGDHLSKVNSLSCSRNQSEMIWALWHGALSCWM